MQGGTGGRESATDAPDWKESKMDVFSLYAYLDPGTGSYVFQLLIATALGSLFAARHYMRQAKGALRAFLARGKRS